MRTRPAVPGDLPRIIEVSLAAFETVTWQRTVDRTFGPLQGLDWRERWRRRMEKAFQEETFLVLEENQQILGYACGTVDTAIGLGHIDILAVDPAARGRGCGRHLLSTMEELFRSQGATHVTLESLVDNETANSLYRRTGYQQLAQHINWFKKLG
ncbi:MAG TPA: GNAT family N-acetyltransferase [Bryobacterales bacterium]|nr:GNAT family N-acetyltransferase [Bryobacterales bacterium]